MTPEPFSLPYDAAIMDDLRKRLSGTRWPDEISGDRWQYGFDLKTLKELCGYWKIQFDWRWQLNNLSRLHHFKLRLDGQAVHFIHERGKGPDPVPLIITHGWPGSFIEMRRIIPLLTDPAGHGADERDSFDVVVPSLPGYGYSDRPTKPGCNYYYIADLWAALMQALGYEAFGAQGGDLGAGVSTALALRHPKRLIGLHLNYIPGSYRPFVRQDSPLTAKERRFQRDLDEWAQEYGGYSHMHRTRPQTLAYGLNDSPAALAAWILEKFRDWSDCDGNLLRRFTVDQLLTNVMLYWSTQTINSSCRLYFENAQVPLIFDESTYVETPTAVAQFPREISCPPQSWIKRGYNLTQWTEMPKGGHFAAWEEPDLLANDIRNFFRPFRERGYKVSSRGLLPIDREAINGGT